MSDFREAMRRAREEKAAEDAAAAEPQTVRIERLAKEREARETERWNKLYSIVYDIRSILLFWLIMGLLSGAIFIARLFQ